MDPANQVADIKEKIPDEGHRGELLDKLFLDERCIEIMSRADKSVNDYKDFLDARFDLFVRYLSRYGFTRFTDDPIENGADED